MEPASGVFFDAQDSEAVVDALRRYEALDFSPAAARRNAESFDISRFAASLRRFVLRDELRSGGHANRVAYLGQP